MHSAAMSPERLVESSSWADEILPPDKRLIGWQRGNSGHIYEDAYYQFAYGSIPHAAVYQSYFKWRQYNCTVPMDSISSTLTSHHFKDARLSRHFERLINPSYIGVDMSDFFRSLIALTGAHWTYSTLPEAYIDLNITSKVLCHARWAKKYLSERVNRIDKSITFACVAIFDTGYLDIDPEDTANVLALSYSSRMYASEMLFCDPFNTVDPHALRQIVGNVGKPGLALPVSPRDTILRQVALEK